VNESRESLRKLTFFIRYLIILYRNSDLWHELQRNRWYETM